MNGVRILSRLLTPSLAAGLALAGMVAAQPGVANAPAKALAGAPGDGIVAGLLAGRDMSEQVALLTADKSVDRPFVDPDQYRPDPLAQSQNTLLARAARQAGVLLRDRQPWQKAADLEQLLATLSQLQAQQMLLLHRARTALARVSALDQADQVTARAQAALGGLTDYSDQIAGHFSTAQALAGDAVSGSRQKKQWRNSLEAVARGLKRLADDGAKTPPPILRALPFDRPLFNPGVLATAPAITPSYEQAAPDIGGSLDLAASTGAPLSQLILAKASELGNDFVAIHEFVRSQIRTEYYSGGMKGAEATLRSGAGNDVDQASLLIALYRSSNVPARYVHGVVRMSIAQVGEPLGLSDASQVLTALSRAGIAHEPVIQGGQIGAVDMAYTWASIYVPYANYRGVPVDLAGRLWLPLAPASKTHSFDPGSNIAAASGLDGEALVNQYLAGQFADPPLDEAKNRVLSYLTANPDLGDYPDQLPAVVVAAQTMKLLPAALPFDVIAVTAEAASLAPERQQTLRLLATDTAGNAILDETVPVSALLDKRVTFSYAPATVGDFNAIREYGGRTAVPAYLVRLRPQLKTDGKTLAAADGDLGMGDSHTLTLELRGPAGTRTTSATLVAGSYAAINLSAQLGLPRPVADAAAADETEGRAARLLHNQAARYASQWDQAEDELAGLYDLAVIRPLPSLALVTTSVEVTRVQGLNSQLVFQGANLDAALRNVEPVSRSADALAETQWMRLAALQGSHLESAIFETQWAVEAISADKGLRQAVDQTLPVVEIDAANAASVLPGLSHDSHVIDAVRSAVDQGYRVLIPEAQITLNAWTGSVWHVWDPGLGASGYFISGALAGGSTSEPPADWILDDLANALGAPYGDEPNDDPDAARRIRIIPASDGQIGKAGENLERPLAVLITDDKGRPVVGATVRFDVLLSGDAQLSDGTAAFSSSVELESDGAGIARVDVKLGESTENNSIYVLLESSNEVPDQVAENWVSVAVIYQDGGSLDPGRPFVFYTTPDDPAELKPISGTLFSYPNGWVGPVQIRLEDQYGNPVANRDIRYNALPAITSCESYGGTPARFFRGDECEVPFRPGSSSCGSTSLTVTSNVFGPYVQVINGDGPIRTRYPVRVSSDGVADFNFETFVYSGIGLGPIISEIVTLGSFGNVIDSALVDEIAPERRRAQTYTAETYGDRDCLYRFGPGDGTLEWRVVGVGTIPGELIGEHYYEGFLPAGEEPQRHQVDILLNGVDYRGVPDDIEVIGSYFYAVLPEILEVLPTPVPLNLEGRSIQPIVVGYQILPIEFPMSLQINLLEDGNVIDYKYLRIAEPIGSVVFGQGKELDLLKEYTVQALVNPGSSFEIVSETFPVALTAPIVKSVTNIGSAHSAVNAPSGGGLVVGNRVRSPLSFFNDVDIPNERICRMQDIEVELTQAASVSMEFEKLDIAGDPTGEIFQILSDESLAAGFNRVEVSADDLGTDSFVWRITAVSDLDGRADLVAGSASSRFITRNSLPVAHPTIRGVDLATGTMVASFRDFDIPGLGVNLRFTRSYSSASRGEPGVLGAGWNHNYASRVVRSNCGDYYVSGGDTGSIRFVQDGDVYRPLKGYHGTLVRNAEDGSFDFYSLSGNRFHFSERQDDAWWLESITDPNGNSTVLSYEPGTDAPKLVSVTDASSRSLNFAYQTRYFRTWVGEVITRVEGPGGITLDLTYDTFGNLVSATREGGAFATTYDYITDAGPGNANLLAGYTDEVFSATRQYEYDEIDISTPVGGASLDVLSSRIKSLTEADGGVTRFDYEVGAWGMNSRAVVTDPRGNTATYNMNEYGAGTSIQLPNGTRRMTWETDTDVLMLSETDENGRRTTYAHDADGNVIATQVGTFSKSADFSPIGMIKIKASSERDFRGLLTTYGYDGAGNLTSESRGGTTTRHTYDGRGSRRSTTDPNGSTTTYDYDTYGYLANQTDAEGNAMQFSWDARGRKRSETDGNGNTTTYSYDDRDRLIESRYADGTAALVSYTDGSRQSTATDARGNSTTTTRDAMDRVIRVVDAAGNVATMSYDANGNKTSETDSAGRAVSLSYDAANRLLTTTEPEGRVSNYSLDNVGNIVARTVSGPGGSRTTTTTYESSLYFKTSENVSGLALTTWTHDGAGNVLTQTDPLGRQTTFTYDAFDRQLTQSGPLGSGSYMQYDAVGNLLVEGTLNTPADQERRYTYDGANRQVQAIDAEGGIVTREYDGVGNVTRVVDERGKATRQVFNSRNWQTQTIDPLGFATSFDYDALGNPVTETQANGNALRHTYDALNRRIETVDSIGPVMTKSYDGVGNVIASSDGNGNLTTTIFDDLNRAVAVSRPGGRVTTMQYNAFDEMTAETDPAGNTISHSYNALGQRVATTGPAGLSQAFSYDSLGNLLSETDSLGRITTMTYDALNNMTERTDPLYTQRFTHDLVTNRLSKTNQRGVVEEWRYDRSNRMTRYTRAGVLQETRQYDLAGNLLFQTDANGNLLGFEYDDRGLILRENRPELAITSYVRNAMGDVATELQPAGRSEQTTYDLRRRVLSTTNGQGLTTAFAYDLNGNRLQSARPLSAWTFEYDEADRMTTATNDLGHRTSYTYDTRGNRTATTDANGRTSQFQYDARSRMVGKTYPDGATLALVYDANGNPVQRTEPNGTAVNMGYDELNREVSRNSVSTAATIAESRSYDGSGNLLVVAETLDSGPAAISTRGYDDRDRLTSLENRFGRQVQYQYDHNGNRTALLDHNGQITNYTYDALNRLSTVAVPGLGTFAYDYLANGLVTSLDYPNGARSEFDYDLANRMTQVTNTQGGEVIVEYRYLFDDNGNRLSQQEEVEGTVETTTYTYDAADRLTRVDYPDRTVAYALDDVGNRLSETVTLADSSVVTRSLSYNARDQLLDIEDTGATDVSLSYDENGNQVSRVADTTMTFSYSPRNKLVAIETDGLPTARFEYNFQGLRMARDAAGQRVEYVYDDSAQIARTNALGNTLSRYHYGAQRRLASAAGGVNRYILHDALRSPVAIMDQAGALVSRMDYDAWGNITEETGSEQYAFGFTGMELDRETGLYHAGARYYDPAVGRFLSEDPLEGNHDNPPSLHRYLYANANPTFYVDPDGLAGYFFDGTNQDMNDPDTVNPTNVGKIFNLYEGQKFYHAGVGTNDGWLVNKFGAVAGAGGDARLERAYRQLVLAYNGKKVVDGKMIDVEPDRDIDIFGFSRGAALGRAFANIINERGIPDLNSESKVVSKGTGRNRRFRREYANTFEAPDIRFLGVYDTVGSFGKAGDSDEGNKDLSIAPNVQNVRHAISRDEKRKYFPLTSAIDPTNPLDPRIIEMIFQGVHTDVGAGYPDDDSLSFDALYWMVKEAGLANVPLGEIPDNQKPVKLTDVVPPKKERYMIRGHVFWRDIPQQGGRTPHEERLFITDTPRTVFYLRNRRPGEAAGGKPRKVDEVTGDQHFRNLELIFDDPYWIVTEDYDEP